MEKEDKVVNSNEALSILKQLETWKDLSEILVDVNLSDFVKDNTKIWKVRLNKIIEGNPKVKEALIYIIKNYTKKRKNNPDKFGRMHCVEAASLIAEHWFCNPNEVSAALLHDVWEDIPNWEEYLRNTYNEDTVNMVWYLTERDKTWDSLEAKKASRKERKLEEMEKISSLTPEVLALKLGDLISNIAETVDDLEKLSPEERRIYWEWFNAGYDKQIWKYSTLKDIIENRIQVCKDEQLFQNEEEERNLESFANKYKFLVEKMDSLMSMMP